MQPPIPARRPKVVAHQQQKVEFDYTAAASRGLPTEARGPAVSSPFPISWPGQLSSLPKTLRINRLPVPGLRIDAAAENERFHYSVSTICCHGRLTDRAPIKSLGWIPGQRISLTVNARTVVAVCDPGGSAQIGLKGHLRLSAAVRHQCGIEPGDRLLVATSPNHQVALVYTFAVINLALAALHNEVRSFSR